MKIKTLVQGNDGRQHVESGTSYDQDGEWARRMLVNGLAEPLDDEAKKVAGDKGQQERYLDAALQAAAKETKKR